MIRKRWLASLALLCISGSLPVHSENEGPLALGVNTHFSQGWPIRYWPLLAELHTATIRDSIHWAKVETATGQYSFTDQNSAHVRRACDAGIGVILVLRPNNPLYDGGTTVYTEEGRTAFARYVLAILDRFGPCVRAVEIGNEINAGNNVNGPAAADRIQSHVALLKDVYSLVKPRHPATSILGGSTNAIGTGFLKQLFAAGALPFMDGVAVHPYRRDPAALDWELARLNAAMKIYGAVKPVWATEFGNDFQPPDEVAAYLVKMAVLLNASGVRDAQWYALVDQPSFPTMGLYTLAGSPKPAAGSFTWLASDVLARGPAERVDATEPDLFHFRFGPDRQIIWGARRTLSLPAGTPVRNVRGTVIPIPTEISDTPIIIDSGVLPELGPPSVLADSLDGYGLAPWQYFARRADGNDIPLEGIDWNWSSYIGKLTMKQLTVNPGGMRPTGGAKQPINIVLRYTAPSSENIYASACLLHQGSAGDGVSFQLLLNGRVMQTATVKARSYTVDLPLNLAPNDIVEFVVGPQQTPLNDLVHYRYRISRDRGDSATNC